MADRPETERAGLPSSDVRWHPLQRKAPKIVTLSIMAAFTVCIVLSAFGIMERTTEKRTVLLSANYVIQRPNHLPEREGFRLKHSAVIPVFKPLEPQHVSVMVTPELQPYPDSLFTIDEVPGTLPVLSVDNSFKPPYQELSIIREPEKRCSLRDELLRPCDLDFGRYRGLIFEEAGRKQKIQGFIRIPTVWGSQLKPPDNLKRSVIGLVEAVNRYTEVRADIDPHLLLDSRRLRETPFIYITTDRIFELTATERKNLGDYLRNGGFAVLDNGTPEHDYSQAEASLRQMLRDSLGAHARFLPIPRNHPLYHCFFDFDDGPPQGSEVKLIFTQESYG